MIDPIAGKLANAIEAFAGELLVQSAPDTDRGTIPDFLDFLTTSPRGAAAAEVKILQMLSLFGEWKHPDKATQDFIDFNLEQMDGSLPVSLSEIATATLVGWSCSEFALREPEGGKWLLQSLQLIPPDRHEFQGRTGQIESVLYKPSQGLDVSIPYHRVVHVVNRRPVAALTSKPMFGIADCRLAIAAHNAWKIVINEALIAGQRQATPIIVGLADDEAQVPLHDSSGNPLRDTTGRLIVVPAPEKLKQELQSLNQNGGVITAGLSAKIQALNQETNGLFFLELLKYLDQVMSLAFLIPNTVLEQGVQGLGNAGLADVQISMLRQSLKTIVDQAREEIIEKVFRPLIEWNLPESSYRGDFGQWQDPTEEEKDSIDLLNALTNSFATGIYSPSDLEAINRHRQLAGIPPVEELLTQQLSRPLSYWKDSELRLA